MKTHARRAAAAAQATTGAEPQKSATGAAQATTGAQEQKSAESIQTAFARMPGGQASSGAPVSAAAASAQATTGAEAQKSVSYGQVTSMATVAHFCCLELQCLHMV